MSLATKFYLWCADSPETSSCTLSIHPGGVLPEGAPARPVSGPLPLGYAEALKRHLEAVQQRALGCPPPRWESGFLAGIGRFMKLAGRLGRAGFPRPGGQGERAIKFLRKEAERWLWDQAPHVAQASQAPHAFDAPDVFHVEPGLEARREEGALTRGVPSVPVAPWTSECASAACGVDQAGWTGGRASAVQKRPNLLVAAALEVSEHALEVLSGRRLFPHEIASALAERGVSFYGSIDALLDPWVHQGKVRRLAGVGVASAGPAGTPEWRCRRCLSPRVSYYPCQRCGLELCPQCDDCRSLGASSACTPLYERPLASKKASSVTLASALSPGEIEGEALREVRVELPFALSPFQERVSRELAESAEDALIWAACGAGKTEVTLEAICRTVRRGGLVLFALPRRDVVDQLGQRLNQALVGVETATLRGGTPHRYQESPVIVATVHQALRFCERFDLVIVDEVDAFPLNREVWLLEGLERAKRPGGRMVLMTATPPERLLRRLGKSLRCFTLPGRPHGHPLPLPEVVLVKGLEREALRRLALVDEPGRAGKAKSVQAFPMKRELPWWPCLDQLLQESLKACRRVLVFVPTVRLAGVLAGLLVESGRYALWRRKADGDGGRDRRERGAVAAVHAGDPEREEKVAAFARGEVSLLVSTSILERGITLPRLDVVVFAADDERVFDAAALVQMAGRAGRSPEDPRGRVVFLAGRATPAIHEAIATIQRFNELAQSEQESPHLWSQDSVLHYQKI